MTQPPDTRPRRAMSPPRELIAALDRGRRFVLLGHVDPDLDSAGSQLALGAVLRSREKHVSLWSPSPLPEHYGFLPEVERISTQFPADAAFDVAVALDAATPGRFGEAPPFALADFPVLISIDHHASNEPFGAVNWIEPAASSVGEMLFGLFKEWGVELTREVAVCLYASIASDTGGFAFSNTSARTFQVAAALVERGVEPFAMWRRLFATFPLRRHALLGASLGTLRVHDGGRIATMRVTRQMLADTGAAMDDTERFVQYPRTVSGVEAAALLREQPGGRVRVALRSNTDAVNVGRIAAELGGGGHPTAAGCTLDAALDEAERTVVAALARALHETGGNA
jgi:phosphoesterase RecJ-like protein